MTIHAGQMREHNLISSEIILEVSLAKASVQHDFELPLETLWDLVGHFGDMGRWTGLPPETCISEGEGVGAIRTLTPTTGGKIIDRLDAQTDWSYSYSIINMEEAPLPFSSYKATLAVERISENSSRLTWSGEFEPAGISALDAVAFAQNMYQRGLEMMKKSAASL